MFANPLNFFPYSFECSHLSAIFCIDATTTNLKIHILAKVLSQSGPVEIGSKGLSWSLCLLFASTVATRLSLNCKLK